MIQNFHVISGLPRSGSTLLSTILRQNPRFRTGVTSPLYMLASSLTEQMSSGKEFSSFFDEARRKAILQGLVDGYYGQTPPDHVVFDTNRLWAGKSALLKELYPHSRIICCVREVGWIVDSIERMLRKNPLQTSRIFAFKQGASIYARTQTLMSSEHGLIGSAWSALREGWYSEDASRLIVIRYESLAADPGTVVGRLYEALGEAPFDHDFENLAYDEVTYDAELGMPGLHKVRAKVETQTRSPAIPPDLFKKHADMAFWAQPNANPKSVLVL